MDLLGQRVWPCFRPLIQHAKFFSKTTEPNFHFLWFALCEKFWGWTSLSGERASCPWRGWNLSTFVELLHTASFKPCWQCLALWWLARRFILVSLSPGSSCLQSVLHTVARLTLLETQLAACSCPTQKWRGVLFPPGLSTGSSPRPCRPHHKVPHPLKPTFRSPTPQQKPLCLPRSVPPLGSRPLLLPSCHSPTHCENSRSQDLRDSGK